MRIYCYFIKTSKTVVAYSSTIAFKRNTGVIYCNNSLNSIFEIFISKRLK